jgi:hypothetical protein
MNDLAVNFLAGIFNAIANFSHTSDREFRVHVMTNGTSTSAPWRNRILNKDEAKTVYEDHIAFCDLVGDEALDKYNASIDAPAKIDPFALADSIWPSEKKLADGYVYLIGTSNQEYKIGWSLIPERRILSVQSPTRADKEMLHMFRCADVKRIERVLHDLYRCKRIQGEWFALTESDVEWIKSIRDYQFDVEPVTNAHPAPARDAAATAAGE